MIMSFTEPVKDAMALMKDISKPPVWTSTSWNMYIDNINAVKKELVSFFQIINLMNFNRIILLTPT
jgi:hypothetical protein